MLYSLIAVICVGSVLTPVLCLTFFRWGVKYGVDRETAVTEPIIPKPKKKPKETAEMKQMRKLDKAIADYNGDK